jgi:predicted nucleic acid-binding protein
MEPATYVLDSNIISDWINGLPSVVSRLKVAVFGKYRICLCQPVHYEVIRGLLKAGATRKQQTYETVIIPLLEPVSLTDSDWRLAAQY